MPVQVPQVFETSITVLLHTFKACICMVGNFVLGEMTFEWKSHATSVTYEMQFLVYVDVFFECTFCGETFPTIVTKLYIMCGVVMCIQVFHTCCRFPTDFAFNSSWFLVFFQLKTACH